MERLSEGLQSAIMSSQEEQQVIENYSVQEDFNQPTSFTLQDNSTNMECFPEQDRGQVLDSPPCRARKISKRNQHLDDNEIASVRKYEALMKREYRKRRLRQKQVEVTSSKESITGEDIQSRKSNSCEKIVQHILSELSVYGNEEKRNIMQEVVNDDRISQLTQDKLYDQSLCLISAIRTSLQALKNPKSNDELFLKRSTLAMITNGLMEVSDTGNRGISLIEVSSLLDIHPRNLYAAIRRVDSDARATGILPLDLCKRQSTHGKLAQEIKDIVITFWTEQTRVSPNKKDVCQKRIGPKHYEEHAVHLLDESQTEYFLRFRETHPAVQIGQRSFEKLKPWFVRKLKDRNTCCCVYHIQMLYLKDAYNLMRSDVCGLHGRSCSCTCAICKSSVASGKCAASEQCLSGITKFWETCVCAKEEESAFHQYKCLMGECGECGVKNISLCPREKQEAMKTVAVQVFEDAEVQNKNGETRKRKGLSIKHLAINEFTKLIQDHTKSFIKHNFTYRWQANQYRDCLKVFPVDTMVSVVDFAENYSFKEQNEIQSMHWHTDQCTILVHITYYRSSQDDSIIKKMHFYIFDDREHDTLFVQHCFLMHDQWIKEQGLIFKQHWVWSDGAASQFKASRPFYFVARFYSLTGTEMTWSFFGSGHGKGEHDGAGAVVKRALTHEQLKRDGVILRQAADVVQFLEQTMAHGASSSYAMGTKEAMCISRKFWLVKVGDVDRSKSWGCERIKGSRSMHSICGFSSHDASQLKTRKLSCFCNACIRGHWRSCHNKAYVKNWEHLTLKPKSVDEISDDEVQPDFAMFEGAEDMLSQLVLEGDNYAVNVEENNDEAVDFYILKCVQPRFWTDKSLRDTWGNNCSRKTYVISGYYYKQHKDNPQHYTLLDDMGISYIYSHLVRAIKFDMILVDDVSKKYYLSPLTHESIYHAMPYEVA